MKVSRKEKMNPIDAAFAAGLFDGEGSVEYTQRMQRKKGKKKEKDDNK